MLEMTVVLQLRYDASCERLPKTIDVSFDFLRFARCATTYGRPSSPAADAGRGTSEHAISLAANRVR